MDNKLNDVIAEIVDAEKCAEEILVQATINAKNIAMVGLEQAEQAKQEHAARLKDEVKKINAAAQAEADKLCAECAKTAEANAAQIVKNADKNVLKTVEWLAEQLVKRNS